MSMTQEEMDEWLRDIRLADQTHPNSFANGPFIRSLFKTTQEIGGVGTQITYLSKSVDEMSTGLHDVNTRIKEASVSSDSHSRAMKYLTAGLVFLGLVQVGVVFLSYQVEQSDKNAKKRCFQSVLQTSDIDLNYKNCLRDHGLSS